MLASIEVKSHISVALRSFAVSRNTMLRAFEASEYHSSTRRAN